MPPDNSAPEKADVTPITGPGSPSRPAELIKDSVTDELINNQSITDGSTSDASTAPELIKDAPLPRRFLVFAIVGVALFMASVDMTVVATALASIQQDLDAPLAWSGWAITVYSLGQVLVLPLAGKFAEQYGRKRVFVIAAILFTAGAAACSMVTDITWLVVLRAVQALGGGAFLPAASGIVADHFGRNRDRALGMFTSIFPIGGIVGPVLGGVFVTYWSWRGIFLVNVCLGVVLIILAMIFIPETAKRRSEPVDVFGLITLGLLILGGMLGITYLGDADHQLLSVGFLLPEVIAVIALAFFLRHARRARAPFIPISMLAGRGFGVMNMINFLQGCAAIGFGALIPLYAERRYDIPTLQAGTLLTARALGMICLAGLATMALRRTGYRPPMMIGFSMVAVGMIGTAIGTPESITPWLWLSVASGVCGLGLGLALPASNNAILQLAPDQVAAISGMRGMFRQAGSIASVSVATAVVSRSDDPGMALAHVFIVFSALLLIIPLMTLKVPEHRGSW